MSGLLSALVAALTWSAVAEFLLLRTLLRLGPVLPAEDTLLPVYQAVQTAGLAAMNLAMLAAAAVAVGLAGRLLAQRRARANLLGGLVLAAVLANLLLTLLLAVLPAAAAVTIQAMTLLVALLALYLGFLTGRNEDDGRFVGATRRVAPPSRAGAKAPTTNVPPRGRVALGLVAGAYTLALYHVLAGASTRLGLALPGGATAVFLAEAAALAAALALPWSFRPQWQRRDLVVGIGLAIGLLAAHTLRPSILAAMTMWNLAFSLFLPGVLYAVGFGTFAATLLALRREGLAGREAATGLLLVGLAGLKLDFSYFSLLALTGLLLCCRPLGIAARPALAMSEATTMEPGDGPSAKPHLQAAR